MTVTSPKKRSVFVEDMGDLFAPNVPDIFIQQVLLTIWDDRNKDAKFLLLKKET